MALTDCPWRVYAHTYVVAEEIVNVMSLRWCLRPHVWSWLADHPGEYHWIVSHGDLSVFRFSDKTTAMMFKLMLDDHVPHTPPS